MLRYPSADRLVVLLARPWISLLLILATALGTRLVFFAGFVGTDDTHYISSAYRLAGGDWTPSLSHFGLRVGLTVPTALAYRLFGVSDATTGAYPLICSVATIPLVFMIGRSVLNEHVGLLAAALLAFFPLDVIFASELFGTTPASLLAGLTLFCYLQAEETARRPAWLVASGAFVGLGYLCADVMLFCLIPLLLHTVVFLRRPKSAGWILAGLASVAGAEALYYGVVVGAPLYRFSILGQSIATQGNVDALSSGLGITYFVQPFLRLLTEQEFGLFPILLVPAIWAAVRRSQPPLLVLVIWVVSIFLYTSYGTVSPFRFAPLPRLPRYLSSATVPAMILLAAWLMTLRPRWRYTLVTALWGSSLACVALDNGRAANASHRALVEFLSDQPCERTVVTMPLHFAVLYYQGFRPTCPVEGLFADDEQARRAEEDPSTGPTVAPVLTIDTTRDALVAVRFPEDSGVVQQLSDTQRVATFRPGDRFYYRLLANPTVMAILSLTRDRYRVEGLMELSNTRIDVYRVRQEAER